MIGRTLFSIFLLSLAISVKGQMIDTLYYNSGWQLTSRWTGDYYRIAKIDTAELKFIGSIRDYRSSGKLLLTGEYNSSGMKTGEFVRYYENGQIFSLGIYKNDSLHGHWKYFDEKGALYEKINFSNKFFTVVDYFDEQGIQTLKNGTGTWEKIFPDGSSYLVLTAYFENNLRVGTWTVSDPSGNEIIKEIYKAGKFQKGLNIGSRSRKYKGSKFMNNIFRPESFVPIETFQAGSCSQRDYPYMKNLPTGIYMSDTLTFQIVENPARYPGGIGAFYKVIQKTMKYPQEALRKGLEGRVFVQFVIDKEGNIGDVEVLRGIGGGCDEEAVRVIKSTGKWLPGEQRGKAVRQRMVIPITFRLN